MNVLFNIEDPYGIPVTLLLHLYQIYDGSYYWAKQFAKLGPYIMLCIPAVQQIWYHKV